MLPGAAPPPHLPGPPELPKDARFKSACTAALGPLARETWLRALDGPAPESRQVTLGGTEVLLASVCKPHHCRDHKLVLLWQAQAGRLHGLLQQHGRQTLLGAPPAPLAREIERIWASEWRK